MITLTKALHLTHDNIMDDNTDQKHKPLVTDCSAFFFFLFYLEKELPACFKFLNFCTRPENNVSHLTSITMKGKPVPTILTRLLLLHSNL